MRTSGFVLAVAVLLAPSLALAQARAEAVDDSGAMAGAAGDQAGAPGGTTAAPMHRSLMGMVMDVLIESAEQQAAREAAVHQPDRNRAVPMRTAARREPSAPPEPAPVARGQVAVESEP